MKQYECQIVTSSGGDYAEMKECKFGSWANMDDVTTLLLDNEALKADSLIVDYLGSNREHLLDIAWMLSHGNSKTVREAYARMVANRKGEQ